MMSRILRFLPVSLYFLLFVIQAKSQAISGKVLDFKTEAPLEFASIGVVNTSIGIVTDKNGYFTMDVTGQPKSAIVRVSMISYKPQSFTIEELTGKENQIKLVENPTQLSEVIIKPSGKQKKVGITKFARIGHNLGWGGSQRGKGWEKGTRIELGSKPVQIKSFHMHIRRQSFKSCQFRLHIRNIANNLPSEELLNKNIILEVTKEKGWIDFDLSSYNLVFTGSVAVSVEWLKVEGVVPDRAMKINNDVIETEYILINGQKKGILYNKRGTEAKWTMHETEAPAFYLTVVE